MRIATITNWAYSATVCLTIVSGIVMVMASNADNAERQAVEQRQVFDQLTDEVETDAWELSDLARLYVLAKDPDVLKDYQQKEASQVKIEHRLSKLKDSGASEEELALLHEGLQIVDELLDEQKTAFESVARGEDKEAVALLYGKVYEQELDRVQERIDHFRQMLDNRARDAIIDATQASRTLRTLSEVMVGLTALLFLFVLGFILKRRVLRPVVRLSDVVHRLASQDYAVETPNFNQIDEIGDMAQAIRIFRENGLARQQLERERDANWAIRELLARMTQRLQGCETFADVINVAELFAPNIAPGVAGRLYILDREPWQMRCVAQWLSPQGSDEPFHPDECWAVRRGQSHPPVHGEPDIICYHLPESCQDHTLCVPLIAQGEAIGLLSFQNLDAASTFSRGYLELMAEALGLALANQRLRDALLEKALYDPLTGLRNRHHLEDIMGTQMSQAIRNKEPISCLMIDIDHFKNYNDRYGHRAGDVILQEIARIFSTYCTASNPVYRIGGEEFAILIQGDAQAAAYLLEKIQKRIRYQEIILDAGDSVSITLSIGIAQRQKGELLQQTQERADQALYRAKRSGRDQLCLY